MFKIKLTKIKSTHNNLRSHEIIGVTKYFPPLIDHGLLIIGEAFDGDPDKTRLIHTSPIKSIEKIEDKYIFETLNSTYKIELYKE